MAGLGDRERWFVRENRGFTGGSTAVWLRECISVAGLSCWLGDGTANAD